MGKSEGGEGDTHKVRVRVKSEVKGGLTWASRVSRGAGVSGASSDPMLGWSQDTRWVGPPTELRTLERQEKGSIGGQAAGPQETPSAPAPALDSLCPLRDDQRWPKHPGGRRVTSAGRLHLAGHAVTGDRAGDSSQRARTASAPHPGLEQPSPLCLGQRPEPLKPLLDVRVGAELVATTFILKPPQLRKDGEFLGRSPQTAGATIQEPPASPASPDWKAIQMSGTPLSPSSACRN